MGGYLESYSTPLMSIINKGKADENGEIKIYNKYYEKVLNLWTDKNIFRISRYELT